MLKLDATRFISDMKALPSTVRKATAYALTDTARDVHAASKARMSEAFDRPTRYTLNSLMTRFARANDATPTATVEQKPSSGNRHYLAIQEQGGQRPQTGVERLLSSLLRGSSRGGVVPSRHARLDGSGNWARGERSATLEALKRNRGASTGSQGRLDVFAVTGKTTKLSKGIWRRNPDRSVEKVASLLDRTPRYRALLGLYAAAERTFAARFPDRFARVLDRLRSGGGGS
ncbi:hypothetical protein [Cereibacter azotoformans]|uniref:Uncharacterized protein n=1 Tax=Cereibacter azotoformans TaxID=43057 RepID=A0A2T5K747_9RHOB|nr:hypothetical protein [Cereibacter azotoformans]MBO4169532.1 hypothetical protein [Cereibacter azotoformans]PTR18209.1 hypothetical protein C8J28_109169 [Cereibacter azotoformans]